MNDNETEKPVSLLISNDLTGQTVEYFLQFLKKYKSELSPLNQPLPLNEFEQGEALGAINSVEYLIEEATNWSDSCKAIQRLKIQCADLLPPVKPEDRTDPRGFSDFKGKKTLFNNPFVKLDGEK